MHHRMLSTMCRNITNPSEFELLSACRGALPPPARPYSTLACCRFPICYPLDGDLLTCAVQQAGHDATEQAFRAYQGDGDTMANDRQQESKARFRVAAFAII